MLRNFAQDQMRVSYGYLKTGDKRYVEKQLYWPFAYCALPVEKMKGWYIRNVLIWASRFYNMQQIIKIQAMKIMRLEYCIIAITFTKT